MRAYLNTQNGSAKPYSEDRVLVCDEIFLSDAACCEFQSGNVALADGVGGNRSGAVAAFQVCKMLSQLSSPQLDDFLKINNDIIEQGQSDERKSGMATTLTGLCFLSPDKAYAYHVGNTRLYAVQGGMYLKQLTRDDTVVEYLLRTGKISEEEALSYPKRNEITACFGGSNRELLQMSIFPVDIAKNDLFIITCDGIHETLSDDEMEEIVAEDFGDWELVAERLVMTAKQQGSIDDCSVIIIDCSQEEKNGSEIS